MESGGPSEISESDRQAFARGEALLRAGEVRGATETFRAVRGLEVLLTQVSPDGRPVAGPDFLIIGAPAGGTTWLKRALRHHPDVFLPPGEPHYFWKRLDQAPTAYVAELARPVRAHSQRPVVGEKSPGYLTMSDERIALCAALFPELRLVCHVREPVARAWSMIRRLGLFGAGAAAAPDPDVLGAFRELQRIIQFGFYRSHLQRWAAHFPPERFLLLDFERVESEPEAVYQQVLSHIGAASHPFRAPSGGPEPRPPLPTGIRRVLEEVYRGEPWELPVLRQALDQVHGGAGGDPQSPSLKARTRLAAWQLILESPVGHVDAHGRLAALLAKSGRPEEAVPHLEALTRLEPDVANHWRDLAKQLQVAGAGARAIAAWNGLLAAAPGDLQAHANLARLYAGEGRPAEAAKHFRVEADAFPGDAKAWRRLAACLGRAGDPAGELDALTRALEIDGSQSKVKARTAALRKRLKGRLL